MMGKGGQNERRIKENLPMWKWKKKGRRKKHKKLRFVGGKRRCVAITSSKRGAKNIGCTKKRKKKKECQRACKGSSWPVEVPKRGGRGKEPIIRRWNGEYGG